MTERDYEEDFVIDQGRSINFCTSCGKFFMSLPSRDACKSCTLQGLTPSDPIKQNSGSRGYMIMLKSRRGGYGNNQVNLIVQNIANHLAKGNGDNKILVLGKGIDPTTLVKALKAMGVEIEINILEKSDTPSYEITLKKEDGN